MSVNAFVTLLEAFFNIFADTHTHTDTHHRHTHTDTHTQTRRQCSTPAAHACVGYEAVFLCGATIANVY